MYANLSILQTGHKLAVLKCNLETLITNHIKTPGSELHSQVK